MSVTRRFFTLSGIAAAGVLAAGCDEETARRRAFIKFLQTRIIDQPGLKFPVVQDEEYAAFGHYLVHVHVMRRFHNTLDASVSKPLQRALQAGKVSSFQELMGRRQDIAAVREGLAKLRPALDMAQFAADTDRAKLTRTKDLEVVYNAAYEKLVSRPARTLREVLPPLERTLAAGQELGDYLHANRDVITLRGTAIETDDAEVKQRAAELVQALYDKSDGVEQAEQALLRMTAGL